MDSFLQTNNDLIISIHKALVESTQEINRKIENLRDDVRDVKLSQAKNDRTMQEEATNWRRHTETIIKELGDRHQSDVTGLHKLLMELCISRPGSNTIANTASKDLPLATIASENGPAAVTSSVSVGVGSVYGGPFHPGLSTIANVVTKTKEQEEVIQNRKTTASIMSTTTSTVSTTAPVPVTFSFKNLPPTASFASENGPPAVTPALSVGGSSAFGGPFRPGLNTIANVVTKEQEDVIQNRKTTASIMSTTTSTVSTTAPAPVTFSFKNPPPPASISSENGAAAVTQALSVGGSSLFGGASRPGSNTFANLAAKAAESGGGFLGSGSVTTGKPVQFGQSPFGMQNAKDFKLFQQPPSQQMFSSNIADESHKGDDGSDKDDTTDEFVPDVHFEPVVPLPPEVEVSTGEEGEEVMFSARCKLYRFDKEARENKERGLGDIKLLYNPRSNRYRCVMRREQVFKLCANFPIYPDLKIHPREHMPTVYTWACKDFSDDPSEGIDVTLSARFKDKSIADEFFEKMMEAVEQSG